MNNHHKVNRVIQWGIPLSLIFVFLVSLIPVFITGFFDFATGDDLGYGTLTHMAWTRQGTLTALWQAVRDTVREYYGSWQGTWFTIAVMSLQPEVFHPDAYWITPWIMIFITVAATTLIMYEIAGKHFGLPVWSWLSVDMLVLIVTIQFFPSTASGIFWFNGGAHYIVPFGIAMVGVRTILEYRKKRKAGYLIGATLTMTALGGSSYLMPVFILVVLLFVTLYDFVKKDYKIMCGMLLPVCCEFVGLGISFLSPGNKNRGGESFGFSMGAALLTILQSLEEAFIHIGKYAISYPALTVCFLLAGMVAFLGFRFSRTEIKFCKPGLFLLSMFCLYAAMYAPGIYAGVGLSGGVPNTIFQVYVLTSVLSIIYFCGWLSRRLQTVTTKRLAAAYILLMVLCIGLLVLGRTGIKHAATFRCIEYLSSGQAVDYKAQMTYNRKLLLDENTQSCVLCPVNDVQGPLMCMPVTEDPTVFTNQVTAAFYGKSMVVSDKTLNIYAK